MELGPIVKAELERLEGAIRARGFLDVAQSSLDRMAWNPLASSSERDTADSLAHSAPTPGEHAPTSLGSLLRKKLGIGDDPESRQRLDARRRVLKARKAEEWHSAAGRAGLVTLISGDRNLIISTKAQPRHAHAPVWYGVVLDPSNGSAFLAIDDLCGVFIRSGAVHFLLFVEWPVRTTAGFLSGWGFSLCLFERGKFYEVPVDDRSEALPWPAAGGA